MKSINKFLVAGLAATVVIVALVWQNRPYQFPPIPTSPLPVPNAYDYYGKASDGAKRDEAKVKIPSSLLGYAYLRYPPQLQIAILQATAPDIKTMRAGFAYTFMCPQDRNPENFPNLARFRELARLRQLQAHVDESRGDWGSASDAAMDAVKIGADVPHGGAIIAALIGVACEAIGRKDIWTILPHLNYGQAQAIEQRLLAIDANRSTFADAQVQEKYDRQAQLQTAFKPRDWANQITRDEMSGDDGAGSPSAFDKLVFLWRLRITGKRAIYEQYSTYQDAVIEAAGRPYSPHATIKKVPLDPITAFETSFYKDGPYSANGLGRVQIANCQTQDRLLIISLALRRYYLKHGHYPGSLSQLVPAYLPVVPHDPFAVSGPLRYIKFGSTYCLYSIGPDGIDDHGASIGSVSSGARPYVLDDSKGDVVAGVNP